ncbi:MAG: SGNH/GDSL hydrolase family protein, partial [Clostridia bacterium]|nr:SGNH/GDSL hydrolase family protein [Clostridia bacterium]
FNSSANRYDFTPPAANEWKTLAVDFTTAKLAAGSYPTGNATSISFWLWNGNSKTGYDELEYIAFFPAGDEGKAAWEAFDSENPSETASSDAYIEGYEGVEAVMTALEENFKDQAYPETADLAEAKAIIEETIITAIGDYDTEYTISDGAEASNGYDFVVTLTSGDNYRARQNRVIEVTLMTSGGKEPLIWRFNNNTALADWNYGRQFNTSFTPIIKDNVLYDEVGASDVVSDFYLGAKAVGGTMPEDLDFNREDYPYIKIKVKQSGFMSQGQIYFGGASNIKNFSAAANTWTTLAYDFSTDKALNAGTYADGNMKSISFWVRNANGGTGTTEIEYIAFFPKGNAGRRAWEAFDSENPTVTASSDAYLDGYELVAPVEEALKTAFADVNTAITDADAAKAAVEATLTTAIGENSVTYTIADPVASEDGFTVKITLNAGANPKACVVKEINVEVKNEYPDPIIWNFNNPEFVSQWVGGGGCDVSFGDDDEGSYLRAAMVVPEDNCNITWTIPAEYRFNATEYPYYAIRYKSSRGGNMQFYPATSLSSNSSATGSLYYQFGMPAHTGDWQTKIWNIKTECNAKNNTAGTWDGELQYLRIDFMRSEQVFKWINIDYIGFFATKEQAEAYVAAPYVEGDKELVDGIIETVDFSSLAELDLDVVDADTASEKLSAFVEALELPEGVTSTQAVFGFDAGDTENADGKVGSYNAKVYFVNGPLTAPAVSSQLISIPLAPKAMIKALGAQIRTPGENQGLRFGASLEKSLFADPDITNISYGTVILPEDVMPEGEKLTLDTVATNPLISVADVKGEVIYSETDAALIYTAVITGISPDDEEACARKFVTRPYVKYTFNGQDYTIYTDAEKTRSVDDVEGLMIEGYDTVVPLGKVGYDRETWMVPFWNGNVVYHELFWPVMPDGAAEDDELEVTLMYPITEVLALKDGTNSVDFAEGKDFYVRDGKLVIPADSAINRTAFNFYIADNNDDELHGQTVSVPDENSPDYKYNGKKLFYKEGTYIQENFQYSISYLHAETWPETALNPTEDYDETTLTATRAKLANKEDLLIGFFGDSITAGGNNTGNYGTHPLTPKWSQMIVDSLNVLYEYDEEDPGVTLINRAVGGKNTVWGRSGDNNAMPDGFAKNEFKNNVPDLFILAFGMNDETTGVANFKANLINIVDQIRSLNPNCEFLLVSNSMPNPLWGTTANRTQYEDVCEEIVTELRARTKEEGGPVVIDCAKLQGMHKELLNIKPYRDMSGNNVNHQNDMLARLYAQTVLSYITDLYK